jgi:hypothetical protein
MTTQEHGNWHPRVPTSWFGRLAFALCLIAAGLIVAPIAKSFHGGGVVLFVGAVGLLWWLRRSYSVR